MMREGSKEGGRAGRKEGRKERRWCRVGLVGEGKRKGGKRIAGYIDWIGSGMKDSG